MSDNMNATDTAALATETVGHLRTLLADIEAGELGCSAAYRHRAEGAVLALETLTGERDSFPGPASADV